MFSVGDKVLVLNAFKSLAGLEGRVIAVERAEFLVEGVEEETFYHVSLPSTAFTRGGRLLNPFPFLSDEIEFITTEPDWEV